MFTWNYGSVATAFILFTIFILIPGSIFLGCFYRGRLYRQFIHHDQQPVSTVEDQL